MNRSLSLITAISALASFASAQCFNTSIGSLAPNSAGVPGVGDDVNFDVVPLNFSFPINGSVTAFTLPRCRPTASST
jgi:hypothetical protein